MIQRRVHTPLSCVFVCTLPALCDCAECIPSCTEGHVTVIYRGVCPRCPRDSIPCVFRSHSPTRVEPAYAGSHQVCVCPWARSACPRLAVFLFRPWWLSENLLSCLCGLDESEPFALGAKACRGTELLVEAPVGFSGACYPKRFLSFDIFLLQA